MSKMEKMCFLFFYKELQFWVINAFNTGMLVEEDSLGLKFWISS